VKRRVNLNSFSALLENCRRKAWAERRLRIAMAGTGGGGYGSRGGDNNDERLRKMVVDHLKCCNPSFGLATKAKGVARVRA
jgi:hypothetical protein